MNFKISRHAREEMERREIPDTVVHKILHGPDQIIDTYGNKKAYQSIIEFSPGRSYLVRVIVNDVIDPAMVVTVYKTSKIEKYWSKS